MSHTIWSAALTSAATFSRSNPTLIGAWKTSSRHSIPAGSSPTGRQSDPSLAGSRRVNLVHESGGGRSSLLLPRDPEIVTNLRC